MTKRKKLKLSDLQVKSFVTNVEKDRIATVKGGVVSPPTYACTNYVGCNQGSNACGAYDTVNHPLCDHITKIECFAESGVHTCEMTNE